MTFGAYIANGLLILGSAGIAVVMLVSVWSFVKYVFLIGDDQERAHAKKRLLYATITLMFMMILWPIVSTLGRLLLST